MCTLSEGLGRCVHVVSRFGEVYVRCLKVWGGVHTLSQGLGQCVHVGSRFGVYAHHADTVTEYKDEKNKPVFVKKIRISNQQNVYLFFFKLFNCFNLLTF